MIEHNVSADSVVKSLKLLRFNDSGLLRASIFTT